jgi:hypothetical protein
MARSMAGMSALGPAARAGAPAGEAVLFGGRDGEGVAADVHLDGQS